MIALDIECTPRLVVDEIESSRQNSIMCQLDRYHRDVDTDHCNERSAVPQYAIDFLSMSTYPCEERMGFVKANVHNRPWWDTAGQATLYLSTERTFHCGT